jgi:hypothetical protein
MQLDGAPACDPKFMRLDRSKSRFIMLGEPWALSPYDLSRAFPDLFRALYIHVDSDLRTIILRSSNNQPARQSLQKVRLGLTVDKVHFFFSIQLSVTPLVPTRFHYLKLQCEFGCIVEIRSNNFGNKTCKET